MTIIILENGKPFPTALINITDEDFEPRILNKTMQGSPAGPIVS